LDDVQARGLEERDARLPSAGEAGVSTIARYGGRERSQAWLTVRAICSALDISLKELAEAVEAEGE
jgi:hypothetical protein